MPIQVLRAVPIWMYGKQFTFNIYHVPPPPPQPPAPARPYFMKSTQYKLDNAGNPLTRQKNQIVLHFTAGNSRGEPTIRYWNDKGDRPNYYCPKWEVAPFHHFGTANPGNCPQGHGQLVGHWASAHYVVELAQHRLNPAAQPYSNVLEVVPSNFITFHGESVNEYSIGIEHSNIGDDWANADAQEDALAVPAHAADFYASPPHNRRPVDFNRWYHLTRVFPQNRSNVDHPSDFQAYQNEQYLGMILLLRYLCIEHRIARRFLGDTTAEKMNRWWHFNYQAPHPPDATTPLIQSKLMRFRGILSHMNCHRSKECGGPAMHRNRLFRGIIDEWWLPLQFSGTERGYHTGPFDPQLNQPSYIRWTQAGMQSELFHDADLDALQETKSYFNLDHVAWYFAQSENPDRGGTFPIGVNYSWHGGVHLEPTQANRKVYAAASGTIVAARLGSDDATERDPNWGSQRFVLIRHVVYVEQQHKSGSGMGINYTAAPKYIFSLYMHLARFPGNLGGPDPLNPPWFNFWLRHRTAAADPNAVFCPDVEVSVGDWLGECGVYRGQHMIHFEVMSHDELTIAPWNKPDHRAYDSSGSAICTVSTIQKFVTSRNGQGLDTIDILTAARELRLVKSYHKSEWALQSPDALMPVLPGPFEAFRQAYWNRLKHFMWVADAVAACPDLSAQLCDAAGMTWHYHPVTFMEFVNRLVVEENGQLNEPDLTATNVALEDSYLTRFYHFANGAEVPDNTDAQHVEPFDVSSSPNQFRYHFSREELGCSAPGSHVPGPTPPQRTTFHLTLLDLLENIRIDYGKEFLVARSHLCEGHAAAVPTNLDLCVLKNTEALLMHSAGRAVDIRPKPVNPAHPPSQHDCGLLWRKAIEAAGTLRGECGSHAGEPSRADLSGAAGSIGDVKVRTVPTVEAILNAAGAADPVLTLAQRTDFTLHLELLLETTPTYWECWIRRSTLAVDVKKVDVSIVGVFNSQPEAETERETNIIPVSNRAGLWECAIRHFTMANEVRLQDGGIIGTFYSVTDAQTEKSAGEVWPRESKPDLM